GKPAMSSTKKRNAKGPVEAAAQQTPYEDHCQDMSPATPAKANKIALVVSLAMLLGWIVFLTVLAISK
ncbi:MAG: hypothetical protein U9N87_10035, partial [Planctomycetota bacterium]|nr:hypothetical protein [Planctomycetota bacterium]